MVRQFVLMVVAALVAALILVKADIVGRLTYSMEKARLQALRESLPSEDGPAANVDSARALAEVVIPAVVSISTQRAVARRDLEALPHIHKFLFPESDDEPSAPGDDTAEDESDEPSTLGEKEQPLPDLDSELEPGEEDEEETEEEMLELPNGQGSGFIFDADNGYILTNSHVVEASDKIHVRLADQRRFEARLLGIDDKTDLAVIRIEAKGLQEIPLGDSASGQVGDEVFSVGSPFGLAGTISRGIISAKNRSNVLLDGIEYQGFLQTDAVINPGNSGGPLINTRGEVIGINNSIATSTGVYDGIGFAIPANRAKRILPQLVRGEKVVRGYLGVSMGPVTAVREDILAKLEWREQHGVIVLDVLPDSPAEKAGLRDDDVVVSYEGERLGSSSDLTQWVADTNPGAQIELRVWREKAFRTLKVEIGKQPDNFSTRGWRPRRPLDDSSRSPK